MRRRGPSGGSLPFVEDIVGNNASTRVRLRSPSTLRFVMSIRSRVATLLGPRGRDTATKPRAAVSRIGSMPIVVRRAVDHRVIGFSITGILSHNVDRPHA